MTDQSSWKHSQAPALMVRRDTDARYGWQANDAALLWAREHEFDDTELDRLATDVGALGDTLTDGALGHTPARHGEMHWHAVPWDDGWLAWCLPPDPFVPTPEEKLDRVEILRHFGRLGMVVGAPGTGAARWDNNAYQLWGIAPDGPRPTPRELVARVHPQDRERVVDLLNLSSLSAGYGNERFRLMTPDGSVRHLHAMLKVARPESGGDGDLAGVLIDDTETIERYLAQRKVAEQALSALELADVGVWRQNLVNGKVQGDSVFKARMCVPAQHGDIDHEWVMAQHHPDDREVARAANLRALQSKQVVDAVVRVRAAGGEAHRTLLTRRITQRDANGRPLELVGVSMDITALVQVNEQAQAWARRAELAAAAAGVGFWYLDAASGEGEWDRTLFMLHGRDPDLGSPSWHDWLEAYVAADDRDALRAAPQALLNAPAYQGRCRIAGHPDGERWFGITLQPESAHDPRRWIGMVTDITDKIASQAVLRIEQQRARFAADAANLAVWECSTDAAPLYWSESMYALLGFKSGLQHRSLDEWWSCVQPAAVRLDLERRIRIHAQRRDTLEHEMHIEWPDGSHHWIALRARVLAGPPGQPERMHGVCWAIQRAHPARTDADAAQTALGQASPMLPLTVVCIEDNTLNLMLVENLIATRRHITLKSAANGLAGLEAVRQHRPELVLIDLQLPDVDSWDVLREIRSDPLLASTLCVALTAGSRAQDHELAHSAGFDACWSKPLPVRQFLASLDALALGQPLPATRGHAALA